MFAGFLAVGCGAALGAWLRWGLSVWFTSTSVTFSMGTLAANLVGGFLVGIAVAYFVDQPALSPAWRLFWITGFLGGLTTFSTFSAEVVALLERAALLPALALATAHLAGSLALTALGIWLYRAMR
jgi:fluoride exporter